jgi:hypothetical protein
MELRRLVSAKTSSHREQPLLGAEVVSFFKHGVQKRQTKFGRIAQCWAELVPPALAEHCALESLHRGGLTVLVDSASHLYELKQLLLAGLEKQLKQTCTSAGLKKITLKPGRWYEPTKSGATHLRF